MSAHIRNEEFRTALQDIRDNLSNADYSTVVSSDQISDLVSAGRQLASLVEQLHRRIIALEQVQNERGEE